MLLSVYVSILYKVYILVENPELMVCENFKPGFESDKTIFRIKLILNAAEKNKLSLVIQKQWKSNNLYLATCCEFLALIQK